MKENMQKTRLKGGSLSGTYLIKDGDKSFVRKEVSLSVNREYGYQRWYSQLKRMQRYSVLFPNLFPKILKYGKEGNMAYFDMEYIEGAVTAHEFLMNAMNENEVHSFTMCLTGSMSWMHGCCFTKSNPESMELYIYEEVERPLINCEKNHTFCEFLKNETIIFNGEEVPSFITRLSFFKEELIRLYKNQKETFIHGNLTLENILYLPNENRVIFIDPYEENVIDSPLADYSQLLQSCNSHYELYNAGKPIIEGNSVSMEIGGYYGLNQFRENIKVYMRRNSGFGDDYKVIQLLEISQYIRMLPFKMEIDESKMIFFYALASKLMAEFEKKLTM